MEGYFRSARRRGTIYAVSGRKPGDPKDPAAVEATLDDLSPVDTNPVLPRIAATITLDEEDKPEPSATQILDPVEDVATKKQRPAAPRPTGVHKLDVSADAPSVQARRRAALKSDAFESFPSLDQAHSEDGAAPRGPPPAWKSTSVWTPGLVAMAVMFVALLLVALVILLRG